MKNKTAIVSVPLIAALGGLIWGCSSPTQKIDARVPASTTKNIFDHEAFADVSAETKDYAWKIVGFQKQAIDKVRDQTGLARRDTHSKTHACVQADFEVNQNLDEQYRVGLFKNEPTRKFAVWLRFANGIGGIHHDLRPDARAVSIKIMGVPGKKVLDGLADEEQYTQDFVMNNFPAFLTDGPEDAYEFFKANIENKTGLFFAKGLIPYTARQRSAFAAVNLTTKVEPNLLTAQYFAGTPSSFGEKRVKFMVKPCSLAADDRVRQLPYPDMSEFDRGVIKKLNYFHDTYSPLVHPEYSRRPPLKFSKEAATYLGLLKNMDTEESKFSRAAKDYLRATAKAYLSDPRGACFDLGVQFYKDEQQTPMELATVVWSEQDAPFVKLGRINIAKQDFSGNNDFCEDLSFSNWHSVTEHKPLGGLNQIRGLAYQKISVYRHEINNHVRGEPYDDFSHELHDPAQIQHYYESK